MRKLRRTNLSEDAYTFVRELLVDGKRYSPGEKISVEELSRELGVSRTPLWGAINRLDAEGIIEVVPRQGVYLIRYDPQKALEIYTAREALEGMATRLVAEKITAQQLAILRSSVDEQRSYLKKGDINAYSAATVEFHERIVDIAGNRTLERLVQSVFAQMKAMRIQQKYFPTHLPQSCDDHERLLKAFQARDPDKAEREARSHIRDLAKQIIQRQKEQSSPAGRTKQSAGAR